MDDPDMARSCAFVYAIFNSISNLKLINFYIFYVNFFSYHIRYNIKKKNNNKYLGHFANYELKGEVDISIVGFLVWPEQQIYTKCHDQ